MVTLSSGGAGGVAGAAEPSPLKTESRRSFWSKLSTAVNVVLVATVLWFSLSSFMSQSPQFTARLTDLFNSRAFHRVSSAFSTLPASNWAALEHQLGHHPWRTAAIMTGISYALADWTAQTCEGRGPFGFSRVRLVRCCLVGAVFLSPLAHSYYEFQDKLFPAAMGLWGAPLKLILDQTIYAAIYNCVFFFGIGLLRRDSPKRIVADIRDSFWQMMRAGWKLWPFVHIVTYTMIPTRFKLLWVDMVEVVWVTYLSLVANSRRKTTRDVVQEVVDTSRSGGSATVGAGAGNGGVAADADGSGAGGSGWSATDSGSGSGVVGGSSFLEQRRAKVALRALAERVDSLRALAAEGAAEMAEARERHADGLSGLGQGMGAAGGDRYESERTTEMEMAAVVEDIGGTAARPNVTVFNDAERGLTEVQIAGAERPGLMLDIMLSMRAQGIGVVQGVIDATDGRLSANVFYVIDEQTNAALDDERCDALARSLRAQLMAAAAAAAAGARLRQVVELPGGGFEFSLGSMDAVADVDSYTMFPSAPDSVGISVVADPQALPAEYTVPAAFTVLSDTPEERAAREEEESEAAAAKLAAIAEAESEAEAERMARRELNSAPPHAATELLAAIDKDRWTRAVVGQALLAEGLTVPESFVADLDRAASDPSLCGSSARSGPRGDVETYGGVMDGGGLPSGAGPGPDYNLDGATWGDASSRILSGEGGGGGWGGIQSTMESSVDEDGMPTDQLQDIFTIAMPTLAADPDAEAPSSLSSQSSPSPSPSSSLVSSSLSSSTPSSSSSMASNLADCIEDLIVETSASADAAAAAIAAAAADKAKAAADEAVKMFGAEVAERADFIETEIQYIEESEGRESNPEAEAETDAASTSAEEESDTSELPPASSAGVVKTR